MIAISDFDEIIKTTYIVSVNGREPINIKTISELKTAYKNYLKIRQPNFEKLSNGELIDFSKESVELVKDSFSRKSEINDLGQNNVVSGIVSEDESENIKDKIKRSIELIRNTDEDLYNIFNLVINKIVISKSKKNNIGMITKGGTSQTSIGVIWLAIGAEFSHIDFAELIIHEVTHTLVFLDEIRYGHFDYSEIKNEKTFCLSAILGMKRPLDKVFHSIVVSSSIINFRRKLNLKVTKVHPNSLKIISDTKKAIEDLKNNGHSGLTIQKRPMDIITMCEGVINEKCCI